MSSSPAGRTETAFVPITLPAAWGWATHWQTPQLVDRADIFKFVFSHSNFVYRPSILTYFCCNNPAEFGLGVWVAHKANDPERYSTSVTNFMKICMICRLLFQKSQLHKRNERSLHLQINVCCRLIGCLFTSSACPRPPCYTQSFPL